MIDRVYELTTKDTKFTKGRRKGAEKVSGDDIIAGEIHSHLSKSIYRVVV